MRTIQVEIHLSESMQIVLQRYLTECNVIVRDTNAELLRHGMISRPEREITEVEALQMLCNISLDRERKIQELVDSRSSDLPWISTLVRETIEELRRDS